MIPIASDLSYECFQLRRRRGELATPPLDNTYRRIYRAADLRPFIADPDMDASDRAISRDERAVQLPDAISSWRLRGGK